MNYIKYLFIGVSIIEDVEVIEKIECKEKKI